MLRILLGAALAVVFSLSADANTIYNLRPIDIPGGGITSGFIETDGSLGPLTSSNVIKFEIHTLINAGISGVTGPGTGLPSPDVFGSGLFSSGPNLYFNFDAVGSFAKFSDYVCFNAGTGACAGIPQGIFIQVGTQTAIRADNGILQLDDQPIAPVPAALAGGGIPGIVMLLGFVLSRIKKSRRFFQPHRIAVV